MWINGMYAYVSCPHIWFESIRLERKQEGCLAKNAKKREMNAKRKWKRAFWEFDSLYIYGAWVRVYFLIHASVQNNLIASVLFWNAAIATTTFTYKHKRTHTVNWCFVHIRMKAFVKIYTFPHAIRINNSTNVVPVAFTTGTVFVIKIPPICSA